MIPAFKLRRVRLSEPVRQNGTTSNSKFYWRRNELSRCVQLSYFVFVWRFVSSRVTGGELFEDIVAREYYSEADARSVCWCVWLCSIRVMWNPTVCEYEKAKKANHAFCRMEQVVRRIVTILRVNAVVQFRHVFMHPTYSSSWISACDLPFFPLTNCTGIFPLFLSFWFWVYISCIVFQSVLILSNQDDYGVF